jgi:hypothetical protein
MKGDKLWVVGLDLDRNPVGRDRILMTVPKLDGLESDAANPEYDVMPDGERFIFNLGSSASAATHYNVVLNWFHELKNRASR